MSYGVFRVEFGSISYVSLESIASRFATSDAVAVWSQRGLFLLQRAEQCRRPIKSFMGRPHGIRRVRFDRINAVFTRNISR